MRPFTVTELNRHIKDVLKSDPVLNGIIITGEISSWKPNFRTGAVFFTIKDENAQIDCVMWRESASNITVPYEVGMLVNLQGSVDFWNNRGQLRFNARFIEPAGAGELNARYEKLKAALTAEGLFDPVRKKSLPVFPRNIAVVTSPEGSAAWDIRQTIIEKNDYVNIYLYPVKVQGQGAAQDIAAAIDDINMRAADMPIDVMIVARGGGSPEERWAFNEEIVVRSIARSNIPIVTGIGHEDNESLSDLAADYYAKTPTAAAAAAVPDTFEIKEDLALRAEQIDRCFTRFMRAKDEELKRLDPSNMVGRLKLRITSSRTKTDAMIKDQSNIIKNILSDNHKNIEIIKASLDALSPKNIMSRGYAAITGPGGRLAGSIGVLNKDDEIDITMRDGKLTAKVMQIRSNENE